MDDLSGTFQSDGSSAQDRDARRAGEGALSPSGAGARAEAPARRSASPWDPALTHRMRVLLHADPLLELKRNESRLDPELRHYDSLALAVRTLDLVIDHMGLDEEVDRAAVRRALDPLLRAQDEEAGVPPDPRRHEAVVDRVLSGLRNDTEQRRPFSIEYGDFDANGCSVRRRLEFRLLADHFHPSGGTVLRLSSEAINLFLNALELDIEDAQAAAEAVVQSQLARGKFSEALQSARNARWQSIRFQEKMARILRETRRDVQSVDWRDEVPSLLAEALEHIKVRLATEDGILETAREHLDVLSARDEQAAHVADVVRLMRDCRARHVDLHDQLMRARNVFLDEQGRQAFVAASARALPELTADVLEPILRMGQLRAQETTEAAFPLFFGARPPALLSLAELVLWQLRPRRPRSSGDQPAPALDLSSVEFDIRRYSEAARAEASSFLRSVEGAERLSSLLERARDAGARQETLELLALMALERYAPEGASPLRVERCAGSVLETCGFYGDELELSAQEVAHGSAG